MRLRWTVVALPAGRGSTSSRTTTHPSSRDVVLDCPPGTRLTDVLPLLHPPSDAGTSPSAGPSTEVLVGGVRLPGQAVVGRSPLLDGAVLTLGPAGTSSGPAPAAGAPAEAVPAQPSHLLELVVLAGPDSGRSHPLRGGRLTCGRSPGCDVTVRDPRLSRVHCELAIGAEGVTVLDLGSTNGTTPATEPDGLDDAVTVSDPTSSAGGASRTRNGSAVPAAHRLALGDRLRVGASLLTIRQVRSAAGTAPADTGLGTRLVHRSPRLRPAEQVVDVRLPAPVQQARAAAFPVLAVLLPASVATALAVWTGSMTYLVLAGLGPVLVAGGWFSTRREARRDGRLGRKEHARATAALQEEADTAARRLAAARELAMPTARELLEQAQHPSGRLWERGPDDDDALRVRLGLAVHPHAHGAGTAATTGSTTADPLVPRVGLVPPDGPRRLVATTADLVSVDLRDGPLAVVEPDRDPSSARFVVGQLATLLPPTVMSVAALVGAGAGARWSWLRLLPHTADGEPVVPVPLAVPVGTATDVTATARALGELVARRSEATRGADRGRTPPWHVVVVVLDDPGGELDPADLSWLPHAHRVGVHVVAVAATEALVPQGCAAVVVPASGDGVEVRVTRLRDGCSALATADRVGPWWADRLSRALAPLRPTTARAGDALPDDVRLGDLLDTSPEQVLRRWSRRARGLAVPLGVGRTGVVTVDIARAGPHALVAGTTGAGKSELLRTWLLALAASHPPSDVAFLLVDYKGGATFDDLTPLPHTVGLLTDLDGDATSRVLHSLRAEVHRRERLLAAAGARDLDGYRASPAAGRPLPRLLVVVDEFRILAEDAPDVLGEFVRLATAGRSLGMHLVLATQRPGGVVSADIRANAALRIALRVQDAAESRDVVDRPDAAWLPAGRPGRAVVVGPGLDETVQTGFSGSGDGARLRLTSLPCPTGGQPSAVTVTREAPVAAGGPADDAAGSSSAGAPMVVSDILRAAASAGVAPATSPWLPALPAVLPRPEAADLPPGTLLLGATDLPWAQARGPLAWSPAADGPAIVLGGPRSGRSTTLEAIAAAAAGQHVPVVRLSAEHGQADADGDPDHLVDVLEALLTAPRLPVGAATGQHGRADGAGAPPAACLRVLLLLDDVDSLLDPAADPTPTELLGQLLRSGHRSGVGVALAGGRSLAGSRLAAAARVRLVHRTTDSTDAVVAGAPAAARELPAVPGRCAAVGLDGQEPPPGAWLQAQVFAPVGPRPGPPVEPVPPWLPRPLPAAAAVTVLPAPDASHLPLGLVCPDGSPWALPLGRGHLFAVSGPPRSGRTSALRLLAHQARTAGLTVDGPPGGHGLSEHAGEHADGGRPTRRPPNDLPQQGPCPTDLLLVDDVDRLDPVVAAALEAWLSEGGGPLADRLAASATVVVAGATDWFVDGFRGLPALVRRNGLGVVLSPGRTDVRDVLGARSRMQQRTRAPGRGLLVDRGRVVRIQIARPDTRVPPDEPSGRRSTQESPASTTV